MSASFLTSCAGLESLKTRLLCSTSSQGGNRKKKKRGTLLCATVTPLKPAVSLGKRGAGLNPPFRLADPSRLSALFKKNARFSKNANWKLAKCHLSLLSLLSVISLFISHLRSVGTDKIAEYQYSYFNLFHQYKFDFPVINFLVCCSVPDLLSWFYLINYWRFIHLSSLFLFNSCPFL